MADCLLEILQEVQLERYYGTFVDSGLTTCEALVKLSMQEYSRYGVASMQDRLRLFKLIQIVKSVQEEGIVCRHQSSDSRTSHREHSVHSSQDSVQEKNGGLKSKPPAVQRPPKTTVNQDSKQKPSQKQWDENQFFAQEQPPPKVHVPEKTEVLYKKGSDTPIFKCRKTLNFSAESDDSGEVSNNEGQTNNNSNSKENSGRSAGQSSTTMSTTEPLVAHRVQFNTKDRPKSFVVDTDTGSPISVLRNISQDCSPALSLQTVKVFSTDAGADPKTDIDNNSHINTGTGSIPVPQIPTNTFPPSVQSVPVPRAAFYFEPLHTIKSVKEEQQNSHAYFPAAKSPSPVKEPYVERIYHNSGYNYGVPKLSPAAEWRQDMNMMKKGSVQTDKIRVCVRKRPLMVRETRRKEIDIVKVTDGNMVVVEENRVAVDLAKYIQEHVFVFDEVFSEKCTNDDVYAGAVRPLLHCVFNRGCATCFAFGQTGAGKSYTLLGTKSVPGVYQLAAQEIFQHMNSEEFGGGLRLWISYYEIYCGQLFDLLNKRKKLQVRENVKQKVCITGLMETQVRDIKALVDVIQYGNATRKTGTTGVNVASSRSHAILQLEVRDNKDIRVGRLSFIDLAGSERASDVTDFNKRTRMEGAEINQSLLALKECIRSIDQESRHTPYRQSKLTHILRDSFTGNSQTVMIANVSPSQTACENTLNTLRYADRVKELRRDSPSKTPTAKSQPAEKSPLMDSLHQTPKDNKMIPPSLFHPSNIQFSSTPKLPPRRGNHSNGRVGEASPVDLSKVLQEAYESPIRGHKLQKPERRRGKEGLLGHPPVVVRREAGYKNSPSSSSSRHSEHYHSSSSSSGGRRSERRYRHERDRHVSGDSVPDRERRDDKNASVSVSAVSQDTPPQTDTRKRLFSGSTSDCEPLPINLSSIIRHSEGSQTETRVTDCSQPDTRASHSHHSSHHSHVSPRVHVHTGSTPESPTTTHHSTKHSSPASKSSLNHSARSNDDIIEEHREIMSHLDQMIDKAKAAMNSASQARNANSNSYVGTADQSGGRVDDSSAMDRQDSQVMRQQELQRTNRSAPTSQHTNKHSKTLGSPLVGGATGRAHMTSGAVSIPVEHTTPPSSVRTQRSANAEIVELAFSKLNQANAHTHAHAHRPRDYDNELFGAKQPVSSSNGFLGSPSVQQKSAETTPTGAANSGSSTRSPRVLNIPIKRSPDHPVEAKNSVRDKEEDDVPSSEDFLKSLVGLKLARQLLTENLAKEEEEEGEEERRNLEPQSGLQRSYEHHLNMMNRNLKAAHLRPFEDLLGSPSNTRGSLPATHPVRGGVTSDGVQPTPGLLHQPTVPKQTSVATAEPEQHPPTVHNQAPTANTEGNTGLGHYPTIAEQDLPSQHYPTRQEAPEASPGLNKGVGQQAVPRQDPVPAHQLKPVLMQHSTIQSRQDTVPASVAAPVPASVAAPGTAAPGTASVAAPVTTAPVTAAPVTASVAAPVTAAPVTASVAAPVTAAPVTASVAAPVTAAPVTASVAAPVTAAPVTASVAAPVTAAPVTAAPVTASVAAPVTAAAAVPVTAPLAAVSVADAPTPAAAPVTTPAAAVTYAPVTTPAAAPVTAPLAAPELKMDMIQTSTPTGSQQVAEAEVAAEKVTVTRDADSHSNKSMQSKKPSWSEVLSAHNPAWDVNQNEQKDTSISQTLAAPGLKSRATQSLDSKAKSDLDSGIATQDHAREYCPVQDEVLDECDKLSDTSTLDEVASLPGGDDGGAATCAKQALKQSSLLKLHVHEDSAFTKVRTQPADPTSDTNVVSGIKTGKATASGIPVPASGATVDISPIKTEKLGNVDIGAMFSPIHPFPITPCQAQVISVPSVITKTLLDQDQSDVSGHSMQNSAHSSMQDNRSTAVSVPKSSRPVVQEKLRDVTLQHSAVAHQTSAQDLDSSRPATNGYSKRTLSGSSKLSNSDAAQSGRPSSGPETGAATRVSAVNGNHGNLGTPPGGRSSSSGGYSSSSSNCNSSTSTSGRSSSGSALHKAQNLLVYAHEEQLSEITSLCKKEMQLLMSMKSGLTDFDEYVQELQEVLSSKAQCIATLTSQIQEFHNISHAE